MEVSSESTQAWDHSDKLAAYTNLDPLQEYWVLDPDKPFLTQYTRDAEGWRYQAQTDLSDAVVSTAFDLEILLRNLYALVIEEE